jgi:glycosyltransferase involved in cell wall biosynthesis
VNFGEITPVILTFNEEPNIGRTLAALGWAKKVVVVDSGSSDGTREILRSSGRVRAIERPFDTHARQWNFAIHETGINTPWVLALDADHVLSDALVAELGRLEPTADVAGYRASFTYVVAGRRLWGSLYPPSVVLFRRERAMYVQDGHTQRLGLEGPVRELQAPIFHDDRKAFSRWLAAQRKYMALEADKLRGTLWADLSWPDRARKLVLVAPVLTLFYCLLWKGCILQGRAGLQYVFQRTLAELLLSAALLRSY